MTNLSSPILVLASKSPRRIEIIDNAWPNSFAIQPSGYKEDSPDKNESVQAYTARIALEKVKSIYIDKYPNKFCVSADTAVSVDGNILLKPSSKIEAIKMLAMLRNRDHIVSTSVSINILAIEDPIVVSTITRVNFRNYSDEEINNYVATGTVFDKSGGYAIQDKKFQPATKIDGCYLNVVGLPICALKQQIDKISSDFAKSIKLLSCGDC
tara:strand:- start:4665 stop:5297 length:633 start_codon:yes stop_codon:yes gene_type:complete